MSTKTYAKLLENQGFFSEALQVYKELLEKSPSNKELEDTIQRYKSVNLKVLEFFTRMEKKEDYEKLERWLCKWN